MKKQNTTKEKKEENILDSFPNSHFASAFGFYGENQTQELEEKTRLFNEKMRKMRERREQQKREYEALSEEEKQKLADEELKYKQIECDKVHEKLLETYPDVNQEIYQAMCEIISAQRKLFDEYNLSYIIETLETRCSFHSIYEEYSKHFVEDKALILSSHSRYTAIAKHSYPALLWIYTHKKDILCNLEDKEVIFIIHPEIINLALLEKNEKLLNAIEVVIENFSIIYNELDDEGVSYQIIKETINGYDSFKINYLDDISSLLPDEAYFLFGTYDVSFISDLISYNYKRYHDEHQRITCTTRNKEHRRAISKHMARRMFTGGLFEASCVYDCLDSDEKERIINILNSTRNCELYAWELSHIISEKTCPDKQMIEIITKMQDAVVMWEHNRNDIDNEKRMFDLMDEETNDKEIISLVSKQQQEAGNVEAVLHAAKYGEDIWNILREITNKKRKFTEQS